MYRWVGMTRWCIERRTYWSLAGLLVILGACGNLTAGGFAGVDVAISGDAPDVQSGSNAAIRPMVLAAQESAANRDDPEGELEAEFTLALISTDGSVASLSNNSLRLRVDLEGMQEADAVSATVPAGRYSSLRVIFTDFEIEVDGGLIINGTPVLGDLEVELEDGVLQVDKPVSLDLVDGGQVRLLIDMNAATWLQAVNPDLRTVAEAVVGNAITVVVR